MDNGERSKMKREPAPADCKSKTKFPQCYYSFVVRTEYSCLFLIVYLHVFSRFALGSSSRYCYTRGSHLFIFLAPQCQVSRTQRERSRSILLLSSEEEVFLLFGFTRPTHYVMTEVPDVQGISHPSTLTLPQLIHRDARGDRCLTRR